MRSVIFILLSIVVANALIGCGSGDRTTEGGGRATISIDWPTRSRLVPVAANSIRVTVSNGTSIITSQLLARPSGGGSSQVLFSSLPVGSLSVSATAYPQSDGTGTAQASGLSPLAIQAGKTTTFSVTMASAIASLVIAPNNPSVPLGQSITLTVTAKDSAGKLVLTVPSQFRWSSTVSAIASIDTAGTLTGVSAGSSQVSVTDSESQLTATTTASVSASNFFRYSVNGHWYTGIEVTSLISWLEARDAASAMTFNGLHGHLATLTTQGESDFVTSHFQGDSSRSFWAGGYQDTSASDYSEPAGGWRWVTGEPWVFTNWGAIEPSGDGNYLDLFPPTFSGSENKWNDTINNDGHGLGYVVEFE